MKKRVKRGRHAGRRSMRARKTAEMKGIFLEALAKGKSVGGAAADAGVSRRTPYKWRASAKFAEAWDEHENLGTDRLEDVATERAVKGHKRAVFQQGKARRPRRGAVRPPDGYAAQGAAPGEVQRSSRRDWFARADLGRRPAGHREAAGT